MPQGRAVRRWGRGGPRSAQSPPVPGDRDRGEDRRENQVGGAPVRLLIHCGGQRGEDGAGQARGEGQDHQGADGAVAVPAGQRGERRWVEHRAHRGAGQQPPGVEHRQRGGERDQDQRGDGEDRAGGHDRARSDPVEDAPDRDTRERGGELTERERRGDRRGRPAGLGGDRDRQDRERVVQDAPAGDLGQAQHRQHPPQPGPGEGTGLRADRGVGHRRYPPARAERVTNAGSAGPQHPPASAVSAGSSNTPAPPHTPVSGRVSSTRAAAS